MCDRIADEMTNGEEHDTSLHTRRQLALKVTSLAAMMMIMMMILICCDIVL